MIRITVLSENTSREGFESEHGLSLFIKTDKHSILFDMGQGELFLRNADRLGIDLRDVDVAVLSHGHYDHGGGLKAFLDINEKADVFVSRYAFCDYRNANGNYIGLDSSLSDCNRLKYVSCDTVIDGELTVAVSANEHFPVVTDLTEMTEVSTVPDRFLHEQYLIITDGNKKTVISGCSHRGVLNVAKTHTPDCLAGGFHISKILLDEAGRVQICELARALTDTGAKYYTCHCTGTAQYEYLKSLMGDRIEYISAGSSIDI